MSGGEAGGSEGSVRSSRIKQLAEGVTLYLGDCREILPTLRKCTGHCDAGGYCNCKIDAVVTDPPYGMKWNTRLTKPIR